MIVLGLLCRLRFVSADLGRLLDLLGRECRSSSCDSASPRQTTKSNDVKATPAFSPCRKPGFFSFSTVGIGHVGVSSSLRFDSRDERIVESATSAPSHVDSRAASVRDGDRLPSGLRAASAFVVASPAGVGLGSLRLRRFGLRGLGLRPVRAPRARPWPASPSAVRPSSLGVGLRRPWPARPWRHRPRLRWPLAWASRPSGASPAVSPRLGSAAGSSGGGL